MSTVTSSSALARTCALVGVVVAAGCGSGSATHARQSRVPRLLGRTLSSTVQLLAARGLCLGELDYGSASMVEVRTGAASVVSQRPAPGTALERGKGVAVTFGASAGRSGDEDVLTFRVESGGCLSSPSFP